MNKPIYDEGWNSYFEGSSSSDNPYSYDTVNESTNHMEWDNGWESAANYELHNYISNSD